MVELSNKKPKKLCPRCGLEGSGPYERWVKNSRHKRYEPYLYFAHRQCKKIKWCYIGKAKPEQEPKLDNNERGF
jgi:hypothetical protein